MGRSVIVGDVHGCADELEELLDRTGFGAGDALFFVGDLVARGPFGPRVLDLCARLGGSSVLGNHEAKLLEARRARKRREPEPRLGPSHARLMHELEDRHWAQLDELPLYRDLPAHDLRIVHAGVVPGVPIEEQDPWVLTHIRTIRETGEPSELRGSTLWGALYRAAPHLAFGHNAVDGLQLHDHATGLDTGCVYGGELTALVLGAGEKVPPARERGDLLVSVRARRAYVAMRPGA